MQKNFQEITQILDRLESIQDEQIRSFDAELLPDLETQGAERKDGFEELQKAIAGFIAHAERETDELRKETLVKALDEKIYQILAQNRKLYQKVKAHRDRLQDSLKGINKGKKVIRAYGSQAGSRPRAISLTN